MISPAFAPLRRKGFSLADGSAEHDIADQLLRMRDIAARELRFGLAKRA